jgi:RNA polymerase-associated protein CTR9
VSLGYNLARVKEACGSLKAAEAEYRELLKQFPQYGDCCLRLACIARARGDTKASTCWQRWHPPHLPGVALAPAVS